ncbi:MAG: MerR family transcriptional regulator [Pseudomonadaceae bacterium]|nr:MerR family transcriptional regulator [Pseudomonadaceae bacterium]
MAAVNDLFDFVPTATTAENGGLKVGGRTKVAPPNVKRESKSAGAYRTISEVAVELGVATHVLRFWESKFPQLKPMKKSGGRRYYKAEDVALLRLIQTLLYDQGMAVRGVQAYLAKAKKKDLQQAGCGMGPFVKELRGIRDMLAGEGA